ncbi:MAG: general secretion pathway protein GspK [Kiritimatiellia bacterium]
MIRQLTLPSVSKNSQSAAVLILALWTLFVLGLLAVAVGGQVSASLAMADHIKRTSLGRCLAEAGVAYAASVLLSDTNGWDGLTEVWGNNPERFQRVMLGEGSFTLRYRVAGPRSAVEIRYGLADEERRVNLNLAPPSLLQTLFCRLGGVDEGTAQQIVSGIREYWEAKNKVLLAGLSARDYYSTAGEATVRFESLQELMLVKGMTPELFARVGPFVTIYGSGKLNFNTIEPALIECLVVAARPGAEPTATAIARKLVSFRAQGGEITVPAVAEAVRQVERVVSLTPEERNALCLALGQFGTIRSSCFRGEAMASVYANGQEDARIAFVFDRDRRLFLHWLVY